MFDFDYYMVKQKSVFDSTFRQISLSESVILHYTIDANERELCPVNSSIVQL